MISRLGVLVSVILLVESDRRLDRELIECSLILSEVVVDRCFVGVIASVDHGRSCVIISMVWDGLRSLSRIERRGADRRHDL